MKSTLNIVLGDITNFNPDTQPSAITNAANVRLLGGSGVDGAIHRAAGSQLRQECQKLPEITPGVRCMTGCAKLTPAGNLPVDYVIHAVGPIWPSPNARDPAFTGEQPCTTEQEARSLLQCCTQCTSSTPSSSTLLALCLRRNSKIVLTENRIE